MIGEYPTDVNCISNLLLKKHKEGIVFFPLIYDLHGSMLENPKIKRQLRKEYEIIRPDFVLFIRDLDGLEDNKSLLEQRKAYFKEFNSVVDRKGIFLLNIYELEALLLSDIDNLKNYFKVELDEIADCMKIIDPKGFLQKNISKYSTGHNLALFSRLDYDMVTRNCRYFKDFSLGFDKIVKN